MPATLTAINTGSIADAILAPGGALSAMAVFERSMYLEDAAGNLLCLLRDDLEPGPLHVLCSGWPDALTGMVTIGETFRRVGSRLLAPGIVVELATATPWRPCAFPLRDAEPVARGMKRLFALLPDAAPPDSLLGTLLLGRPAGGSGVFGEAIRRETEKGLAALSRWLREPGTVPGADVFGLVGLGAGLTPSGDDILAGAMLALHGIGDGAAASALAAAGRECFSERTNRISQAHLLAAAAGLGAAVFHDCLAAIPGGGGALPDILPRLSHVGHSSGWDALLGMVWILRR